MEIFSWPILISSDFPFPKKNPKWNFLSFMEVFSLMCISFIFSGKRILLKWKHCGKESKQKNTYFHF